MVTSSGVPLWRRNRLEVTSLRDPGIHSYEFGHLDVSWTFRVRYVSELPLEDGHDLVHLSDSVAWWDADMNGVRGLWLRLRLWLELKLRLWRRVRMSLWLWLRLRLGLGLGVKLKLWRKLKWLRFSLLKFLM